MPLMPNKHFAEWMIIYVCPPGQPREPAGIFLVDNDSGRLLLRVKEELDTGNEDIALVWRGFAEDLTELSRELGADEVLKWLEDSASNSFQLSEHHPTESADLSKLLDGLYLDNVG
jgi:hypothetical protein